MFLWLQLEAQKSNKQPILKVKKPSEEQKRFSANPKDPFDLRKMDVNSAFQKLRKKSAQSKLPAQASDKDISKALKGLKEENKNQPEEAKKQQEDDDEILEPYIDGESDIDTLNESDYELGHMISKSNISVVYRALHYNAAKLIIVKSIEYEFISSEEFEDRIEYLKDCISNIKRIKWNNIVKLIGVNWNVNQLKAEILMEYVPGGSLNNILDSFWSFKENLVKIYVQQILTALSVLHSEGIVHGDIKLENILVDDLGTLKLSDFWFIKRSLISTAKYKIYDEMVNQRFEEHNHNYQNVMVPMINSEMNTPPEILQKSDHKIDPSYDIWCLGMVMYEMLTGKHIFEEIKEDPQATIECITALEDKIDLNLMVSHNCK